MGELTTAVCKLKDQYIPQLFSSHQALNLGLKPDEIFMKQSWEKNETTVLLQSFTAGYSYRANNKSVKLVGSTSPSPSLSSFMLSPAAPSFSRLLRSSTDWKSGPTRSICCCCCCSSSRAAAWLWQSAVGGREDKSTELRGERRQAQFRVKPTTIWGGRKLEMWSVFQCKWKFNFNVIHVYSITVFNFFVAHDRLYLLRSDEHVSSTIYK